MTARSPSQFLLDLAALAADAGREILTIYDAGFESAKKTDGSPVTIADQRAEAIIRAGLAQLAPDWPIVGEEGVEAGDQPECGDRFVLVDPLDGTREFVRGDTGEFSVNIAFVERGAPVMGAVVWPTAGKIYVGGPEGAFRASVDGRRPAAPRFEAIASQEPQDGIVRVLVSRAGKQPADMQALLAKLPPHSVRSMSSSLKLCLLAEGSADLYFRPTGVSEWDLAAGHAILAAAGGDIVHFTGAPLRYAGISGQYDTKPFIAYAGAFGRAAAERLFTR